jgi:hypothetical protein
MASLQALDAARIAASSEARVSFGVGVVLQAAETKIAAVIVVASLSKRLTVFAVAIRIEKLSACEDA